MARGSGEFLGGSGLGFVSMKAGGSGRKVLRL